MLTQTKTSSIRQARTVIQRDVFKLRICLREKESESFSEDLCVFRKYLTKVLNTQIADVGTVCKADSSKPGQEGFHCYLLSLSLEVTASACKRRELVADATVATHPILRVF